MTDSIARTGTGDSSSDDGDSLAGVSRGDREVVRLARGGSFSVLCTVISQIGLMATGLVLTRFLERSDVGLYAQAHALAAIVSLIALSGMKSGLTRFVAMYRVDDDDQAVRGVLRLGLGVAETTSVAMGVGLYLLAEPIATGLFDDIEMVTPVRWAGFMVPGMVLLIAALSATQGHRNVRPFNVVRRLFEPLVKLSAVLAVVLAGGDINAVMAASAISTWAAGLLALLWLRRLSGPFRGPATYQPGRLFRFAAVSWGAGFAAQGLLWADILMVGWFRPSEEVGVYQIASRVAMLAALSIVPLNSVLAPRLADLFRRDRNEEAGNVYQVAAGWALRLTLPAATALLVMPKSVLSVFGAEYRIGAATILILIPGQLFNASTGSSATTLNMAGENLMTLIGNTSSLVLNLGLNAILIPRMGIEGAAIAWSASLIIVNTFQAIMVRRRVVSVWPWTRVTATSLLAAALGGAGGVALHQLALNGSTSPWTIFPVGIVVFVIYVVVVASIGITREDRLIVERFIPKKGIRSLR